MCFGKIKLVTLDATNTLLKFRIPPWQHYAAIARDHGFSGTEDDIKSCLFSSYKIMSDKYPNFGKSTINWEQWWKNVVQLTFEGKLPVAADVETVASRLINEFRTSKCWRPAEGAAQLVQLLRTRGITIGIISNFDPRLYDILQSVKMQESFNFVVTSYETGFSKPDERIFKCAVKQSCINLEPRECLHIGDDLKKDYDGARAAGWHALLVSKLDKTEKPPAVDHVFSSLEELVLAIKNNELKL